MANEGEILLCTVEKVSNTVTQVRLPDGREGTIISSEIAPGRIKHMRQYVVPNKKIVCKVLNSKGNNLQLSLRRVNNKEKKDVMQKWKAEQAIKVAFKRILGDKESAVKQKILENFKNLNEFMIDAKKDKKIIIKFIPKPKQEAIAKIAEKKKKNQEMKQILKVKCLEDNGVKKIKELFKFDDEKIKITYLSAGQFKLTLSVEDFKQGKKQMAEIMEELESKAKKNNCEFFATEEK
jgi:translation initiation factor 2 alpha subunit (eIF-2alpha)